MNGFVRITVSISQKYCQLRTAMFEMVTSTLEVKYPELKGKLRLTGIDTEAMIYFKNNWKWHSDPSRQSLPINGWRDNLNSYRKRFNKRIELAIWYEGELCCLMLGRTSRRNSITGLYFVDGNNGTKLLKGRRLEIATTYLNSFSVAINSEWAAIRRPFSAVEPLYKKLGYTDKDPYDKNLDSLCKNLLSASRLESVTRLSIYSASKTTNRVVKL
jgi:hypothetical protein